MAGTKTMSDLFCGAGGSTEGAARVAGLEVPFAANHWEAAVRCHQRAHPRTRHVVADLNSARATKYRDAATDILWASPVCKPYSRAHSPGRRRQAAVAAGTGLVELEAADEANRVTPWAILDWVEAWQYRSVIVENVAEISWRWSSFDVWVNAMMGLGYGPPQLVSANSAFFGAATHRNRLYVVFTRLDTERPDLELTPEATCANCGHVGGARQTFNSGRVTGNWGAQYHYECGACRERVVPAWGAFSTVADVTADWPTVASRTRRIATTSLERLQVGVDRFGPDAPWVVGYYRPGTWRPLDAPLGTITCRDHHFLIKNPPRGRDPRRCRMRYVNSTELAAAMGFDATYPWEGTDEVRRTMIGNAVTPPMAAVLLERVCAVIPD